MNVKKTVLLSVTVALVISGQAIAEEAYSLDGENSTSLVLPNKNTPKATQTAENILDTMSEGGIDTRGTDSDVHIPGAERKMTGYDEALLEHIRMANNMPVSTQTGTDGKFAYDVEGYHISLQKEAAEQAREELQNRQDKNLAKEHIRYAKGYCFLSKDILVRRMATYAYFDCDFSEPIGRARLAVSMVPEYYAKALVGNPLYVSYGDKRLPVANGVVLTKDKNSLNLANIVNDRLLEKIVVTSGYTGLGIVAQQAQNYLTDKSAARTQTTSTVSGGLTPVVVQDTRTLQPRIEDYWAAASIQAISEIAKIIGENMVENLPYTFKADKGSIYFADLQFAYDGNMEGYKIRQSNIVKKEPAMKKGILTQNPKNSPAIPVLNNHGTVTNENQGLPDLNAMTTKVKNGTVTTGKQLVYPNN